MDDNATRRPEAPDLPDADPEDESAHAPKRLVMSRELRGWMAVFAAVAVAVAAVAPTIDLEDLTGAASLTAIADDASCSDEDQSSGFDGQNVGCSFNCPTEAGTVTVTVDADDSDATVSGTASCGGDKAHCSGGDSCTDNQARTSGGGGTCSASSDEFYDSGLYVECSAAVTKFDPPIGPKPGSEWCPVDGVQCIQSACYQLAATNLVEKCQAAWEKMQGVLSQDTSSTAYQADATGAAGLTCRGLVCAPIVPVCLVDQSVLRCIA
jgi:hypothetical protein